MNKLDATVRKGDKICFCRGQRPCPNDTLPDTGRRTETGQRGFRWGVTITSAYFPQENSAFFEHEMTLIDWLGQYTPPAEGETFARGFLGRMLFSGEEALKKTCVLSGGERVRCMLSRMMLTGANVLILDEPTNHLDLESITALNDGLIAFSEVILFASHDQEFVSTVANRIIEITQGVAIDRTMDYEDDLEKRDYLAEAG